MTGFIMSCGYFGIVLAILTVVVAAAAVMAFRNRWFRSMPVIAGLVAAAVGFLGQTSGIYHSLTVIIPAEELDPSVVGAGLRESFNTTWWGTGLLLLGILAWTAATLSKGKRK